MEVSARLDPSVGVPGNCVNISRSNQNYAHRTNPALALFGIITRGLRNFKLNTALYLDVWKGGAKSS